MQQVLAPQECQLELIRRQQQARLQVACRQAPERLLVLEQNLLVQPELVLQLVQLVLAQQVVLRGQQVEQVRLYRRLLELVLFDRLDPYWLPSMYA